ncbi:MAG TPA: tetratricopeptide repeat protein, partial [Flavisolibacter sp.]|nr:tetratricopeptide repeat protein [Flavisolibacter sp.]
MSKRVLKVGFIALLFFSFLLLAVSQNKSHDYRELLRQYTIAQHFYNKATALSKVANYGDKEEALEKEQNGKALAAFTSLLPLIPQGLRSNDSLRFYTVFRIGELQHYFEHFGEAIKFYKLAIDAKKNSALPDSLLFKPLLYAGIIFYNQNKFDTAVLFFKQAEGIQTAYKNGLTEAERLYNILGVLHYERGNYKQAKNYFQKALAVLPPTNPYFDELLVNYKINLAQMHMRLEEYDKANQIYTELLPKKINLNEIHHNIGSLNLSLGRGQAALLHFKKVVYQNNKIVRLYNNIGQAFFKLNMYDSAAAYYQKAVRTHDSLGANADMAGYGMVLKNMGDYQRHFKHFNTALSYYQKALRRFYPAFSGDDVLKNPAQFSGVFSYINLFTALIAKAEAWHDIYLQNHDGTAAQEELKVYKSAFALISYVERTYESD